MYSLVFVGRTNKPRRVTRETVTQGIVACRFSPYQQIPSEASSARKQEQRHVYTTDAHATFFQCVRLYSLPLRTSTCKFSTYVKYLNK